MNDYFSVSSLHPPAGCDELRRAARQACLDLHRVQWPRAYLSVDGARLFCWYRALDAESIRLVLRQQGASGTSLWPAVAARAPDVDPGDAGQACTVFEFDFVTSPAAERMSMQAQILAALEIAGHRPRGMFASADAGRLAVIMEGNDPVLLQGHLFPAACAPSRVTRCTELVPILPLHFHPAPGRPVDIVHRGTASDHRPAPHDALDAVIIGAGMSGICTLARLLRMGLRARVLESGRDAGGVWHWNRYPGARIDSESYAYGFSFSDDLLREWQWQDLFASRSEISDYLRYVVDRLELRRHMQFDTRVTSANYDESSGCWWVQANGERMAARYLIAASGSLTEPRWPAYPGIDQFGGVSCHTARWPASGIDLAGKRVGVVGTGASGVQVIETIAADVRHLTVFQRSPGFCIPRRNRALTDDDRNTVRRNWPRILEACRSSYSGFIHQFDPRSGLTVSAEEREAKFEALWRQPGFAFWFANFGDLMMNAEVNAHASEFMRRKIRERVRDPDVAQKLLPAHPFGAKRVALEDGYYEVFNRDNVRLVDLRDSPIQRITAAGISTSREEHLLDVIVFATGFDAGTGALGRIDLRGAGGISLADKWREGPKTFLGMLVEGFPNLFIVNGPHNAAALCNAGRCIEQNVDWIARCITFMRDHHLKTAVPTAAAEKQWTNHVHEAADATLLRGTDSWFFANHPPGDNRLPTIYAGGAFAFKEHCERAARAGFAGLVMS